MPLEGGVRIDLEVRRRRPVSAAGMEVDEAGDEMPAAEGGESGAGGEAGDQTGSSAATTQETESDQP